MKYLARVLVFGATFLTLLSGCACFQRYPHEPTELLDYAVKVEVVYASQAPLASFLPGAGPAQRLHISDGSGSVFYSERTARRRALVLAADHVCGAHGAALREVSVQRVTGDPLPARIVYEDPIQDLCVLEVDGYVGPAAQLARALPPLGEMVHFPSAPMGLFGGGVGFLEQAHYAGRSPEPMVGAIRLLLGGTTAHGASGSGIFYRGHLVGVLIAVVTEAGYLIVGVELDAVRGAVAAGYSALATKRSP